MKSFLRHSGVAAPILRSNIDTDAIIPSREMKRVSKQGLGEALFAGWRYTQAGGREPNLDFVLNRGEYQNTTILLSGDNFGCGSSREHAVWALREYGIRVILAPGFGSIFYNNCIRNGLLPIQLADEVVKSIAAESAVAPQEKKVAVDLKQQIVVSPDGISHSFDIDGSAKDMLLNGLDPIAMTLQLDSEIAAYETLRRRDKPWVYSPFSE